MRANPWGNGAALTDGALGGREGVALLAGCLVAGAPDVELLCEDVDGLESGADEGPEVRTGVSEADCPSLTSVGTEPFVDDAEGKIKGILFSL